MKLPLDQLETTLRRRLAAAPGALLAQLAVALAAYSELSPTEALADADEDMLLFQWGTYDWGDGRWFEVDLTRQFLLAAGDDEDDEPVQLSLTMRLTPTAETASMGRGSRWCHSAAEREAFGAWVEGTPVVRALADRTPARSALTLGRV